jgi:predicted lactoylglutathione lyase
MTGTPSQTEWAERIKAQVGGEFDRVAASFRSVAEKQIENKRIDTEAIISILEEKRAEVMAKTQAGYFIQEWQEISDQVRKMILADARYQAIKAKPKSKVAPKT